MPHLRRLRPLVVVVAVGALAACTSAVGSPGPATGGVSAPVGGTAGGQPSASSAPPAKLDSNIATGATAVPVDTVVTVSATGGAIVSVVLSYQDPKAGKVEVPGEVSTDSSTWTAAGLLEPATNYTLSMVGQNSDGAEVSAQRTFTTHTLSKNQEATATIIQNGSTVGIAMPVIVKFNVPIKDRAAIEAKLSVTSVPSQPGGWAWYSNNEVHFRPRVYWQPGTKVSVNVPINGVATGGGVYGKANVTGGFTVGRSFVMKPDYSSHQMQVFKDGKLVRTVPISGGKPGLATRSGIKVITEKLSTVIMDSATVGIPKGHPDYYRLEVKNALRITWSGEFIHSAPWSVGSQGRANVSHGCTNISPANAQWLIGEVLVGDPVESVNSGRALERGNGWTDWNGSFEDFVKHSALPGGTSSAAPTSKPTTTTAR